MHQNYEIIKIPQCHEKYYFKFLTSEFSILQYSKNREVGCKITRKNFFLNTPPVAASVFK